jgi:RNA polymerase sigma-70 factor (ECF subfamily)
MESNELIQRCLRGEEEAVTSLIGSYQPLIFRLALSILDDPCEAEEAVQDVLMLALRSLGSFQGGSRFTTWLTAITVNVCRDRLRRKRSRFNLFQRIQELYHPQQKPENYPEEVVAGREENQRVWKSVSELDDKHRIPLILHYYHNLSVDEIAAALDLPKATVYSRLQAGRDKIYGRLKAQGWGREEGSNE